MLIGSWKLSFPDGLGALICPMTLRATLISEKELWINSKSQGPCWESHLLEVSGVPGTESESCGLVTAHLAVSVKVQCGFISYTRVILPSSVGLNLWSAVKGVAFFSWGIQRSTLAFETPGLCCVFHLQQHLTNRSSGAKLVIPRCDVVLVILCDEKNTGSDSSKMLSWFSSFRNCWATSLRAVVNIYFTSARVGFPLCCLMVLWFRNTQNINKRRI